jgi:putative heme iron utilization protein
VHAAAGGACTAESCAIACLFDRPPEDAHLKLPAHALLHLLHRVAAGTLATHSRAPQGFPYPSILPFAPDAQHRPTILVSRLAEHTRNLQDDARAGFLLVDASAGDVLNAERITLLGRFAPVEAAPPLVSRYLRYQPDAQRYLALGDFSFWTLMPERMRYIGGFGAMGWLDAADLDPLEPLASEDEAALIDRFERDARRGAHVELLGVDRYGADLRIAGARARHPFSTPLTDPQALSAALEACLSGTGTGEAPDA